MTMQMRKIWRNKGDTGLALDKRALLRACGALALTAGASWPALAAPQAATAPAQAPRAIAIQDDRGQLVKLGRPPQRVVSLLPSLTETTCAIGACARLIGVDRYSNFPPQVQKLPQVGGGLDPNIEAIVALKPDVVLMATSSRAADRLRALGV